MAGLRLGFAVGRKELVDAVKAVKSPYNVNRLSQALGTLVLEHPPLLGEALETILASKKQLVEGLEALLKEFPSRFTLLPSATNFASLRLPDGEGLRRFLEEQGISVRYTAGLVRITCGTPEENRAVLGEMASYFAAAPAAEEGR